MDVSLGRFFPFVVVFFCEWLLRVFGDVFSYVVLVHSLLCHSGLVVVEDGCEVYVVPVLVSCDSGYLGGGPQCLFEFLFESPVV